MALDKPTVAPRVLDELALFARKRPRPVSLKEMYEFGLNANDQTILAAAQYLHEEVPVRLARMARQLDILPAGLARMPTIQRVHGWYLQSFQELRAMPFPADMPGEEHFRQVIARIKKRHDHVMEAMAVGVQEFKDSLGGAEIGSTIQEALDRFYTSRISIRVLLGQHVALRRKRTGWVGVICESTSPHEVSLEAAKNAQDICRRNYSSAPEVQVFGNVDLKWRYIPSHLHHMLFELLKNSMRAIMETQGDKQRPPSVKVIIAGGDEDVTIKVADQGGGIPRSGMPRIWTYLYTTAERPPANIYTRDFDAMAGYGFGLPLSRLYARYFGGDLQIMSMEGYGTDAYLHLGRLGTHREKL